MSCNRVFAVSDTHFGHRKVIEFEPARAHFATIEEHDRELVERWNATVKPKDTVWHLGDVFFGGRDAHGILASLNGLKRLVLGNHDAYPDRGISAVLQSYLWRCRISRLHPDSRSGERQPEASLRAQRPRSHAQQEDGGPLVRLRVYRALGPAPGAVRYLVARSG